MTASTVPAFYNDVEQYLQQGDLFRVNVVTPYADREQRLFRTTDARHGSAVFAEAVPGTVFETSDLKAALSSIPTKTALHSAPFERTFDGQRELVVVFGDLAEYFLIITQTCDVSGHDKAALPYAMILPARTIISLCRSDRVPFEGEASSQTIEYHLAARASGGALLSLTDPIAYFALLRQVIDQWKPQTAAEKTNRSRIRNFVNKQIGGAKHVFYLQPDATRNIPDLFVEFSGAYTVDTSLLEGLRGQRVARIAVPYREDFAKAFADRIARIAVPAQPAPKQIQ